uniref:PEP-CTERM sorting domain-containing protein n=1 Tax=Oscillatoriales cyanobacterium SpSt-402 TaxID=2282168 RepID=A0A832H175_9CYAN
MKFNQIPAVLGVATAAVVSTIAMPEQATAATFQLASGVTSVFLDLPTLESVGLQLTGATDVVDPVSSDFLVGFTITPATTFTFTTDGGFAPVSGTIEHTGSVTFNSALTVGNFSIGFDPVRAVGAASGFFVRDTITTGAILFDVAAPSSLSFSDQTLKLDLVADLLVSSELAGVLGNPGLAGAEVGAASINGTAVPEPTTMLGALAAGGFLAARRRLAKKGS